MNLETKEILKMNKFENPFNFELPEQLLKAINEMYEKATKLDVDLYKDEIRSWSRLLDDDDKEREVIQYFNCHFFPE